MVTRLNGTHHLEINWALILNILLLMVVILGAWFTTFSGPLNEKFASASESNKAAIAALSARVDTINAAQEKAVGLAIKSVEALHKETNESLGRRFASQDKSNDDLKAMNLAITNEIKATIKSLQEQIEERRSEIVTRSEVMSNLQATRLEFLSEIKRIENIALASLSNAAFQAWKTERDLLIANMQKRLETSVSMSTADTVWAQRRSEVDDIKRQIESLRDRMAMHERDDRNTLNGGNDKPSRPK